MNGELPDRLLRPKGSERKHVLSVASGTLKQLFLLFSEQLEKLPTFFVASGSGSFFLLIKMTNSRSNEYYADLEPGSGNSPYGSGSDFSNTDPVPHH